MRAVVLALFAIAVVVMPALGQSPDAAGAAPPRRRRRGAIAGHGPLPGSDAHTRPDADPGAPDPGARTDPHAHTHAGADPAPQPVPRTAKRRRPHRPPGLGVHARLPGPVHGPGGALQPDRATSAPRSSLLTLIIRFLLVPLFRKQIVSQRRMQMLQPELKAIQVKYKGNRAKISEEQMKLYRDRGVNPASGCLPGGAPAAAADAHVPGVQPGTQRAEHQLDAPGLRQPGHQCDLLRPDEPPGAVHQPERLVARVDPPDQRTAASSSIPAACPPTCPRSSSWSSGPVRAVAAGPRVGPAAAGPDAHDVDAQR